MKSEKTSIFPRFALNRPITVFMAILGLLVIGAIAFSRIPVELMPEGFIPPFLGVWAPYPNANPQEIEEQIAKPIEEQLRTIGGARRIRSYSGSNGCWTEIEFSQDTDMDLAYSQLRDRLDRVKSELPDDVDRLWARKFSDSDDPIVWVAIIPNPEVEDPYYLVEQLMQKPLERIDGVAKVDIWGAQKKTIQILINQDKVKSYNINLYAVIQHLRQENFTLSSGHVTEGEQKIYVRSVNSFDSIEEMRNLPIPSISGGSNIRLKDIAEIRYGVPERHWRLYIDDVKAITLGVYKESNANTVALCEQVETMFSDQIRKNPNLKGFRTEVLFNQGGFIIESINNLKNTMIWGGIFAFVVLFFFLRRFRMTLIVSIAIPFSILISLATLYFIGWSLNLITMMGLMVSIGMVVDNSIVVLENIYRKRTQGLPDKKAALEGASEVSLAVITATLTTIVVFLPLILMNDEVGFSFYMTRIGLPIIFSLLASLLVAMIFIPLASAHIVSRREMKEPAIITGTNNIYSRILNWSLHHRVGAFVILFLVLSSMIFAAGQTKVADRTSGNINDFRLIFDLPQNYTMEDTERLFFQVEELVKEKREEYGVRTILMRFSNDWGQIRVFLKKPPRQSWYEVLFKNSMVATGLMERETMLREEVVEDVKSRLPDFPGVDIRTTWWQEGGDDNSVSIVLYGDDTTTLTELSKEVERRLRSIEKIISIENDLEKGNDEICLRVNREQAKKYGISPQVISGTVQYALRGFPLPEYQTEEKEIDVRLQLREEDRENLNQLKNMTFFTESGVEIPLDAVATFSVEKGMGEIRRENGKTSLSITAKSTSDDMEGLYRRVDKVMRDFQMPYGYSWSKGRSFQQMQEGGQSQQFALILSITFVFLLMGVLFESFILPWAVIISIPFAFVGAYWMLFLTDTAIELMSRIGFIILVGIVVNNAIVLIDLVNRLRREGLSRTEALLEGGRQRYRPILMTAFTTICGLIPMAVGNANLIGIPYAPLGRTIIGGLLTSTILSLIAVPWAYTLFDDARIYFFRLGALLFKRSESLRKQPLPASESA
ncbi:MAG: hypothetical protein B6244_08585 [Candidatus Cloacimonetes bacterium 4572_55]|nr:MAG: hypothetical protein B6244_08585 [Candidatus Cloacimonetes bacterium 4572_55]